MSPEQAAFARATGRRADALFTLGTRAQVAVLRAVPHKMIRTVDWGVCA